MSRWALALLVVLVGCRRDGIRGDDAGPVAPAPRTDAAEPSVSLLGRWRAETTGRLFDVRAKGDAYTFHVVSAKEWGGAYQPEEVRFALHAEAGGYQVTDRYRPFSQSKPYADDGARVACTSEFTADHEGKPLRARLLDSDALEVDFAHVQTTTLFSAADEIQGCKGPTVVGRLKAVLRRLK